MGKVLLGPVFVGQRPYGYGDKKHEEPWKIAIADACREQWQGDPIEKPVRLKVTFYLDRDLDLTGMLESTVNAIASVVFPPSTRGGHRTRWNHQDEWVCAIEASKTLRPTTPGVEILIEEYP